MFIKTDLFSQLTDPSHIHYDNYRKYMVILVVGLIGFAIHIGFLFLFYYIDLFPLFVFNFISLVLWAGVIYQNYHGRHSNAIMLSCIEITAHSLFAVSHLGADSGFQLYLWPMALFAAVTPKLNKTEAIAFGFSFILIFGLLETYFGDVSYVHRFHEYMPWLYFSNAVFAGIPMVACIIVVRAITEQQREELTALATKDELTGLYNRRYVNDALKNNILSLGEIRHPYCVVLADVDYFKKVNDSLGHDVGDEVLSNLSHYLQQTLRESDIISRWGGEEFLVLLRDTPKNHARIFMNKIRQEISEQSFIASHPDYKVTMSFGIAESNEHVLYGELIKVADKNLYQAKANGRNCIVVDD